MSLRKRFIVAASVAAFCFLALGGYALDNAFRKSLDAATRERLEVTIYMLMSAAEVDRKHSVSMPLALPEESLNYPNSGVYGGISNPAGKLLWASNSALGKRLPFQIHLQPGHWRFQKISISDFTKGMLLSYGVSWELGRGSSRELTFHVIEEEARMLRELSSFRKHLWGWFFGIGLFLLLIQSIFLSWTLRPFKTLATNLKKMRESDVKILSGDYPQEVSELVKNLNQVLAHEREQRNRFRDSLSNLAHSLKTPLAVAMTHLEGAKSLPTPELSMQLKRIQSIVDYHLQRARMTTHHDILAQNVPLKPLVERLLGALSKVYRHKAVQFECWISLDVVPRGDEEDLMECLGNLLDNAFKFCESRVRVVGEQTLHPKGVKIQVEDDGPGIVPSDVHRILERGVKIEPNTEGQGIGLAVLREIVENYSGKISIGKSQMGGACFTLIFPRT